MIYNINNLSNLCQYITERIVQIGSIIIYNLLSCFPKSLGCEYNIFPTFVYIVLFYSYFQLANNKEWGFHNARVNCVAWSPDTKLVASGSLDTNIIVWHVEKPAKHIIIKSK